MPPVTFMGRGIMPAPVMLSGNLLSWPASTSPGVTGYKVGYDTVTHIDGDAFLTTEYPNVIDVGNVTSYTLSVGAGTYYWSWLAYDAVQSGAWHLPDEGTFTI